jgi:cation:H+ antiporter
VSMNAALSGNSAISLGNVVGSNIANIALILGISALIYPLDVHATVIRRDIPVLIFVSALLLIIFIDGSMGFTEGLFFLIGIIVYTVYNVSQSKQEKDKIVVNEFSEAVKGDLSVPVSLLFTIGGLALLVFGANIFVDSAVAIAENMGISDAVIGLTIIAIGTSLPELITSVVAAYKKEADIAIGNVVGSNIFNILGILGVTAVLSPIVSGGISYIDMGLMLFTAIILLPLSKTGFRITRLEGLLLVSGYIIYVYLLIQ